MKAVGVYSPCGASTVKAAFCSSSLTPQHAIPWGPSLRSITRLCCLVNLGKVRFQRKWKAGDNPQRVSAGIIVRAEGDDHGGVATSRSGDVKKADGSIVSPFEEEKKGGLYSAEVYELNRENVDLVLNEVRPYLISDGGNVEVVSVDDGVVSLRLQGACGTCPSSTTTMNMGIERILNEKFGSSLKAVVQVDQQQIGATVMGVDSLLETLRPAIHNYGGFVEVVSVSSGEGLAVLKYKGPAPIGIGVQAAIKDKFPDILEVVLEAPDHA